MNVQIVEDGFATSSGVPAAFGARSPQFRVRPGFPPALGFQTRPGIPDPPFASPRCSSLRLRLWPLPRLPCSLSSSPLGHAHGPPLSSPRPLLKPRPLPAPLVLSFLLRPRPLPSICSPRSSPQARPAARLNEPERQQEERPRPEGQPYG